MTLTACGALDRCGNECKYYADENDQRADSHRRLPAGCIARSDRAKLEPAIRGTPVVEITRRFCARVF